MITADFNPIPIQAAIRGYHARKERDEYLLDKVTRITAKQILENPEALLRLCPEGKTPVYFPDACSKIVIKQSGNACEQRFGQMVRGKQLCQQMGYTHLVLPKMCVIADCLIEERLPLNTHPFDQAQAYLDNKESCTPAIEPILC